MGSIQSGGLRCIVSQTHGVIAVEQTSMPSRRKRLIRTMLSIGVRGGGAVVHQRVGLERNEGVDVVGGGHPELGAEATDLADVAARLVGIAHADADELEQRVLDDLGDHHPADKTRAPDDNSFRP